MADQDKTIQRYLLGELPEAEQDTLEQEYFADERLFERIVQAENEMLDRYARGLLPASTRERFEKYYLAHPNRRERATFAEALAARLEEVSEGPIGLPPAERWFDRFLSSLGPRLVWAFAGMFLLFAIAAGWSLLEMRRLRQELARARTERTGLEQRQNELEQQATNERLRADKLSEEIERRNAEQNASPTPDLKGASTFATLIIAIGGTRDVNPDQPKPLVIPAAAEQVRLQLKLNENDYSRYQAAVQSASGNVIYSSPRHSAPNKKSGANLVVLIPARLFAAGDYILTIRGFSPSGEGEDISKSLIRVERR